MRSVYLSLLLGTTSATPLVTGAGPTDFPANFPKPAGTAYYAAPSPLGNDSNNGLTKETPKTLKGAINFAPSGSLIWLLNGRYSFAPQPGVTDPNWAVPVKTLTIWAMNRGAWEIDPLGPLEPGPYGPRFQRSVIVDGLFQYPAGCDISWGYVDFTTRDCMSGYPDQALGETWFTHGLGNDTTYNNPMHRGENGSLRMYRCGGFTGYGRDQVPFDPTFKYPEFNSPLTWYVRADNPRRITDDPAFAVNGGTAPFVGHDDPVWSTYNTIMWGPGFASKRFKHLHLEQGYFRDMGTIIGSAGIGVSGGSITIVNNWFARAALDLIQTNVEVFDYLHVKVHGNIFQDAIGNPHDCGNPHSDIHQNYTNKVGGTVTAPQRLLRQEFNNNFYFFTTNCRGKPQGGFYQTSADHQITEKARFVGLRWRNNLLIGIYKGFEDEGQRDGYFRNNITVNPLGFDASGNAQPANFNSLRLRYNPAATLATDAGPSRGLLYGNIFEGIVGDAVYSRVQTLVSGYQGASVPYSTIFRDLNEASHINTAAGWWDAATRKAGYTQYGPQYASLREFLGQSMSFTGERCWTGFLDSMSQPLSTQILSNLAYIHGGNDGDIVSLTGFPPNAQWRVVDQDETTVLTDWNNAATANLTVGKFFQLRKTTPGTNSTPAGVNFSIGGYPQTWVITTVSANDYPASVFSGLARLRVSNTTSMGLSNTQTLWYYFRGKPAASQAGVVSNLAVGGTSAQMFGTFNIGTTNRFGFSLRNATSVICSSGQATLTIPRDGNTVVEHLVAVDMSQGTYDTAVQAYQRIGGAAGTWTPIRASSGFVFTPGEFIDLQTSASNGTKDIYFLGTPTSSYYEGEFQALAMGTGNLDITLAEVREKFSADNIGELAKGPAGIRPLWWFVGKKTLLDAGTNLGTARAPTKEGAGTITAGANQAWPVPLGTILVPSPGPYAVGVPITITVKPLGYISTGNSVTLSAGSGTFDSATKVIPEGPDGVDFTFTPTVSGDVTITGTAPGINGAAPPLTLTIA